MKRTLIYIAVFLGLSTYLFGQPPDHPVYNEPIINGQVQLVSSRISIAYSVDEQVVASYIQAAVSLAERTGIAAPVINVLGIIVKMELADLDR